MLVIFLKLNTVTLFYSLFIPILLYVLTYQFYKQESLNTYFYLIEDVFLCAFLVFNILFSREIDNNRYGIQLETIVIVMLLLGNLITYIQLSYDIKVFILSTHFYLRYYIIALLIMYSNITYKTFVKVMYYFSSLMIINAIVSILQFIFGEVFMEPFLGGYYYAIRNGLVRCIGIFPWSTELGTFSGVYLIAYYFLGKHLKNKYFYFISFLCLLNILLAQARLAFLTIIVILLIDNIKSLINMSKYILLVTAILIVLSCFIDFETAMEDTYEEYFSTLDRAPRIYYVIHGIDILKDYPIFGMGFDRYGTLWIRSTEDDYIFLKYGITRFGDLENSLLSTTDSFLAKLLPETGIYGTLLFLTLFVILLFKAWKIKNINPGFKCFLYIIIYSLIYIINSAHSLFNRNMGPIFWVSAGYVIKYYFIYFGSSKDMQNFHAGSEVLGTEQN